MFGLIIPLLLIFFCGYVIWRAGDTFLEGSNYIGRNLRDGVKGATINAVASSMPELFIALFFLFYLKDVIGFSGGLGTSFGSVLFNSLIIPSVAIIGVLSSVVGAFYYLRIVKIMYFDEITESFDKPVTKSLNIVIITSGILILLFFVYPSILIKSAGFAASALF